MTHEIDVNKTRSPALYYKQIESPVVTALSDCYFDLSCLNARSKFNERSKLISDCLVGCLILEF